MNIWFHLFKKEVRLGLPAFLLPIVSFFIVAVVTAILGSRAGFTAEAVTGVAMGATGLLVFYLIYYLMYSLQAEQKKLHLWLHHTLPGYALILAKVAAALLSLIVTMLITGSTLLISMAQAGIIGDFFTWGDTVKLSAFFSMHIILIALQFAVWFVFYWMIYLLLTRRLNTFFSFLLTFLFFIIVNGIYGKFSETRLYSVLTNWGEINISGIMQSFHFSFMAEDPNFMSEMGQITLFFGSYFFQGIVVIGLFILSAWLLDRKVEV